MAIVFAPLKIEKFRDSDFSFALSAEEKKEKCDIISKRIMTFLLCCNKFTQNTCSSSMDNFLICELSKWFCKIHTIKTKQIDRTFMSVTYHFQIAPDNFIMHRKNGPALILKNRNKQCLEAWYRWGNFSREDGPAIISWNGTKFDKDNNLLEEGNLSINRKHPNKYFIYKGLLIKQTEYNIRPVNLMIQFFKDRSYFNNGKLRKRIEYRVTKQRDLLYKKIYFHDGIVQRENKPAEIFYHFNGQVALEIYYENGEVHRTDGPAKIAYNRNGQIRGTLYAERDNYFALSDDKSTSKTIYNKDGKMLNVSEKKYRENYKLPFCIFLPIMFLFLGYSNKYFSN